MAVSVAVHMVLDTRIVEFEAYHIEHRQFYNPSHPSECERHHERGASHVDGPAQPADRRLACLRRTVGGYVFFSPSPGDPAVWRSPVPRYLTIGPGKVYEPKESLWNIRQRGMERKRPAGRRC